MTYKILVVSDLHLGELSNDKRYNPFLSLWDEFLKSDIKELLLMGDIFDIFIGNKKFWKKIHPDFFIRLQKAHEQKKRVTWVQGNHDFQLASLLQPYGVHWIDEHEVLERGALRISVSHGDLADKSEKLHPLWRKFLSSCFMEFFIKIIPEDLAEKVIYPFALKLSTTSRKASRHKDRIEQLRSIFRNYAKELHETHNSNLVILGHSHISDNFSINPTTTYLNLGSWFESPQVGLLELDGKDLSIKVSPLSAWLAAT